MTIQSNQSGFLTSIDKIRAFLVTSFIWAMFSLTLIGIPFATLGLFAMLGQWVQGRQAEFGRDFLGAIRNQWRKALFITTINLIVGGLLYFNFTVFQFMSFNNLVTMLSLMTTICVATTFVGINIYIWSLMPMLKLSTINTIKLGMILMFTYPLKSVLVIFGTGIPISISLMLSNVILLFVMFPISAYIAMQGAWWVLHIHFDEDEIANLFNDEATIQQPQKES